MANKIISFRDLEVYQKAYRLSIVVMTKIVPRLPESEKYDLKDQLSRSSKAIPRLIAEGYAKKHQRLGFQKYLDDAMAETNETIVSLSQSSDIYKIEIDLSNKLIKEYDILARQIFCLSESWSNFKYKKRRKDPKTKPINHTGCQN